MSALRIDFKSLMVGRKTQSNEHLKTLVIDSNNIFALLHMFDKMVKASLKAQIKSDTEQFVVFAIQIHILKMNYLLPIQVNVGHFISVLFQVSTSLKNFNEELQKGFKVTP